MGGKCIFRQEKLEVGINLCFKRLLIPSPYIVMSNYHYRQISKTYALKRHLTYSSFKKRNSLIIAGLIS